MPKFRRHQRPKTNVMTVRATDAVVMTLKKRHWEKVHLNVPEMNIAAQPTRYSIVRAKKTTMGHLHSLRTDIQPYGIDEFLYAISDDEHTSVSQGITRTRTRL